MRREPTFDPFDDDEAFRPLSRPRPLGRMRVAGRLLFAAALIAGLTAAALDRMRAAPHLAATGSFQPAALGIPPDRVAPPTERALLRLDPARSEPIAQAEPPRWSPATGLREDALASGTFEAIEAPFLRVTLSETTEGGTGPSLFVVLARRAAETRGLSVVRAGLRGQVETKFGPFETVAATLGGSGHRACLGFRSLALRRHRIDGWLCGILGQPPEPRRRLHPQPPEARRPGRPDGRGRLRRSGSPSRGRLRCRFARPRGGCDRLDRPCGAGCDSAGRKKLGGNATNRASLAIRRGTMVKLARLLFDWRVS